MSEQRLIDANALPVYQRTIRYNTGEYVQEYVLAYDVRTAPTIDAVEVVHGRWVKAHGMMPPEYHHRHVCSVCDGWALQDYFGRERFSLFCPHCGAKMDGGAEG